MSIEDLIVHLRIEKDNWKGDKSAKVELVESKENLVEGESSRVKGKTHAKGNKWKSTYMILRIVILRESREVARYEEYSDIVKAIVNTKRGLMKENGTTRS